MTFFTESEAMAGLTGAPPPAGPEIDPITNRPIQIMRAVSPEDPFIKSLGRDPNPDLTPGAATQAAMSLSRDPAQRARIAQGMSGGRMAGTQIGPNGQILGVTQEGTPFPLVPEMSLRNLPNWMAGLAGHVPSTAGGIAGGLAAGPASLVAGPAMAAAGSGIGDLARQYGAHLMDPASKKFSPDLGSAATEAAIGGAWQLGGALLGRAMAPSTMGLSPADIGKLREGPALDRARAAYAAAQGQGVQLTPGQATGLPSLLAREDVAARAPWGMDRAAEFYDAQAGHLARAGQRQVDALLPTAGLSKTEAALQFADHAGDASHAVRKQGNVLARDAYAAAEVAPMPPPWQTNLMDQTATPGINPAGNPSLRMSGPGPGLARELNSRPADFRLYDMLKTPDGSAAYGAAVNSAANDGISIPTLNHILQGETVPFQAWDHMKKVLQGQSREAARAGNNYHATQLTDMANAIKNEVSGVNPAYADALRITAPYQRMAQELADSAVGRTGGVDASARAREIVAPIFQQSNPEFIAAARQAFIDTNGEAAWRAGLGAFVKDELERASTSATGLNASMLRRNLIGKEDTRAALEAAMTPTEFSGFTQFMDTVENVAKTFPANSLTQPRAAMAKQMTAEAATGPIVRAGQAIGNAAFWKIPERAGGALAEWGTERNLKASLDYLFTADGLSMLETLAKTRPGTQNAINVVGQIMARGATAPSTRAGSQPQSIESLLFR